MFLFSFFCISRVKKELEDKTDQRNALYDSAGVSLPPRGTHTLRGAQVDTGSSNLAVAGSSSAGITPYYVSSSSSTYSLSGASFSVQYAEGSWSANRVSDKVQVHHSSISPVTVEFAAIYASSNFFVSGSPYVFQVHAKGSGNFYRYPPFLNNHYFIHPPSHPCSYHFDEKGILGMAYVAIARPSSNPITPIFDTWVASGLTNSFGMQLCVPSTSYNAGTVTVVATPSFIHFGAQASDLADLASGSFVYAPQIEASYYEVMVTGMALGGVSLGVSCSIFNSPKPAIVDR